MKHSKLMIAVALLVLVAPLAAQTGAVQATIPFGFIVQQTKLPAGEYRVIVERTKLRLIRIDTRGIGCFGLFNYIHPGPDQGVTPKLIFNRYGSRYFLAEVWTGNGNSGEKLSISSAEREYARATKPASTTVLARQVSK